MLKKKSYMNKENIISEGFFKELAKAVIPAALVYQAYNLYKNRNIKKLEKEVEQHEKNIKLLRKKQNNAAQEMLDQLEKDTGVKISKNSDDIIKDFFGE